MDGFLHGPASARVGDQAQVPVPVPSAPAAAASGGVVLQLRGRIEGRVLEGLGRWLDQALSGSAPRVGLDLRDVSDWSLLAEAMMLNTAERLAAQHRLLVLLNPSPTLRGQSLLGLFDRLCTEPARVTWGEGEAGLG